MLGSNDTTGFLFLARIECADQLNHLSLDRRAADDLVALGLVETRLTGNHGLVDAAPAAGDYAVRRYRGAGQGRSRG